MLEMCLFMMLKCDNHVKYEPRHGKTNSVVSEQVRHNGPVQAQKMARGWKFLI